MKNGPEIGMSNFDKRLILNSLNSITDLTYLDSFVQDNPEIGKTKEEGARGLGSKTISKILKYREEKQDNKFDTLEELMEIKGIGPDILSDIAFSFRALL